VWVNGVRHAPGAPHVSAFDRGLTLADGVFETMRVYGGAVFRLDRHLARLAGALDALAIAPAAGVRDAVLAAVADAAAGDPRLGDAAVRVTVTRGAGDGVAPPALAAPPTVVVAVRPLPEFPARLHADGLTAHVASGRRNERAMTAGLKTLAYTDSVAAMLEARRAGADEALFLDTDGHCSEAAASNLFAVAGGALVTPPLTCGALPGRDAGGGAGARRGGGNPGGRARVRPRRAPRRRRGVPHQLAPRARPARARGRTRDRRRRAGAGDARPRRGVRRARAPRVRPRVRA
jgi:branched-chain amino acid aminotransferase